MDLLQIPQMQLLTGDIDDNCLNDLALMLEDLYNIGEQKETSNKKHGSDHSYGLAGRMEKGKQLTIDSKHPQFKKFNKILLNSADEYIKSFRKYEIDNTSVSSLPDKWKLHFQHVWSIYQFEGDYNPIHYHDSLYDSTLSGFIHMNVPEGVAGIWNMNTAPSTNTRNIDGTTELLFNTNSPRSALDFRYPGNMFVIPTPGTYFMFPSWLNHTVYPFRGEGCRVSISWNIGIEWIWPND